MSDKHLFERQNGDDLILAIGYSFSDDLDVNVALREDVKNSKYLVVVEHSTTEEKGDSLFAHRNRAAFVGLCGELVTVNTAKFIRRLWEQGYTGRACQTTMPEIQAYWETHERTSEECASGGIWRAAVKKWAQGLRAVDLAAAVLWFRLGEFEKAKRIATAVLESSRRKEQIDIHFSAGLLLGWVALALGEPKEGLQVGQKLLRFAESLGDSEAMAKAFNLETTASAQMGKHSFLMSWTNRLADRLLRGGSQYAPHLENRAEALDIQGRHRKAIKLVTRALGVYRQKGQTEEVGRALVRLARFYRNLGAHKEAGAVFEEAANVHDALGNQEAGKAFRHQAEIEYILHDNSSRDLHKKQDRRQR